MRNSIQAEEQPIEIGPSAWLVIPWLAAGVALCFVYFPFVLLIAFYKSIEIACWKYRLYMDRIVERKGIFSVTHREVNYSRIKSIKRDEPFLMRLVGLSIVTVKSSDPYMPEMTIYAIGGGDRISDYLKKASNYFRKREGVREFDAYSL